MNASTTDLMSLVNEIGPGFAGKAAERDAGDAFVAGNYQILSARGVMSALVPAELGGGGASHREMCAFIRALARHCSSTALALSMHQHLVSAAVFNYRHGRPGWKVLEKVAATQAVLVSTGANDWLESSGRTRRVDGGFRVSAAKPFASGVPAGNILVTSAPFDDPQAGPQVLHFPVPLSADGVTLKDDWEAMGMRATGSHTVVLEDVFVPEEAVALRRPRGAYHPAWNVILTNAMPLIMSAYLGVAEEAAETATALARRRAGAPETAFLAGELANELTAAQIAVEAMIGIANDWDFAPETETGNAILIRKTLAARAVLAVAEKAMQLAGGAGFYRAAGLERLVRDLHGAPYHPLPEKRQQLFTGRLALGLPPVAEDEEELTSAAA